MIRVTPPKYLYQIKIEDLFEYIDKAERHDPSVQLPSGLFSSKAPVLQNADTMISFTRITNQKPPEDFKSWLSDEWFDVNDMLSLEEASQLIGYNDTTLQRWGQQKKLKTAWYQNHLFTTRDWLINYLAEHGFKIQRKSSKHIQLLLRYYE